MKLSRIKKKKIELKLGEFSYLKEYGPKHHIIKKILCESFRVMIVASLFSSLGGLGMEFVKKNLISLLPLIILLPSLNDAIGNFGTIMASRFSTLAYEAKRKDFLKRHLRYLLKEIIPAALVIAFFASSCAIALASLKGFSALPVIYVKIIAIAVLDMLVIVGLLFLITVKAGLHYCTAGKDPNNYLIPLTTSIADLGNMLLLSLLIILFF